MNENRVIISKMCTDCIHVKVNSKSKYKNPDLHCTRRGNSKLTGKDEARWCSFYKELKV